MWIVGIGKLNVNFTVPLFIYFTSTSCVKAPCRGIIIYPVYGCRCAYIYSSVDSRLSISNDDNL